MEELMRPLAERCSNPWNSECRSTRIGVYIDYRGRRLPICRECWAKIVSKNIVW